MLLNTKFNLHDKVKIVELDKKGVIVAIYISDGGAQYSVRYFDGFTPHIQYFYEDEIKYSSEKKVLGFVNQKV